MIKVRARSVVGRGVPAASFCEVVISPREVINDMHRKLLKSSPADAENLEQAFAVAVSDFIEIVGKQGISLQPGEFDAADQEMGRVAAKFGIRLKPAVGIVEHGTLVPAQGATMHMCLRGSVEDVARIMGRRQMMEGCFNLIMSAHFSGVASRMARS